MRPLFVLIPLLLTSSAWAQTPKGQGHTALVEIIDAVVADPALAGARVSIYAARADGTGRPLYARQADQRLHPASNNKVVTTAAALVELGPTYNFRTDLVAEGLKDGVAKALYLVGRGDSRLTTAELLYLIEEARFAGLKRVDGPLIVDDTYFTPEYEPPGYSDRPKDDASYRAPNGALSLNYNAITVLITPADKAGDAPTVRVKPESDYPIIVNKATTTKRGRERLHVRAKRAEDGRTQLTVSGRISLNHGGVQVRKRIDHPALFAGYTAKAFLGHVGITVQGPVQTGTVPSKDVKRLGRHYSPVVGSLVADINKWSNNLMAEGMLRAIGKRKKSKGDWASGAAVVRSFLEKQVGLRGFTYVNGSGLFGKTAFSAKHLVTLLQYMHTRRPALPEFAASLALGGRDGTLRRRYKGTKLGQVRGKTGTLSGVICLTGYVSMADGTPAAFSILTNDVKARPWKIWKVQDAIVRALIAFDAKKAR
jgi:D-alanyl-D-alanine carboxypeptidase/D-alanyl-D-alanine-endopeptidase (penicillin-binding protein 4)